MPVFALSVTEPGEQNVAAPPAVMLADGIEFTVTEIVFDVAFPQVFETTQS